MGSVAIKSVKEIVSCSDNGQHPLIYINLKGGSGQCQYCGQKFILESDNKSNTKNKIAA